jgi:hypothetical protein
MSIAQLQENYWVKGNMNELVVCIGKKGDEIIWSHAFSWTHSDVLTVSVKNEVMNLYTYRDSVVKRSMPPALTKDVQKKVLGKASQKLPEVMPLPQKQMTDTIYKIKSSYPVLNEKTLDDYYNYLNANLSEFQRRSFKEFDYLTVEPSIGAVIFIYIFALLIAVGVNFIVINNEIYDESAPENKKKRKNPYNYRY